MKMSTSKKLFGRSAGYLDVIDTIMPIALTHEYRFVSDEWFAQWHTTESATVERINFFVSWDLVERAHLAAITSLMRTKRWADATCLMYDNANFVGWAASVRGLLESAGDTLDGLLNIPLPLAEHHRAIRRCLAGEKTNKLVGYTELERKLDHFVHGRWMRTKRGEDNPLKAKDNADYVGVLERAVPGVLKLYHQLCAVCHPSNESIKYFYDFDVGHGGSKVAPANDAKAIAAICTEYSAALPDALMMSCNPPLCILRVLHKFSIHPKLTALNRFDWKATKLSAEIERHLKN